SGVRVDLPNAKCGPDSASILLIGGRGAGRREEDRRGAQLTKAPTTSNPPAVRVTNRFTTLSVSPVPGSRLPVRRSRYRQPLRLHDDGGSDLDLVVHLDDIRVRHAEHPVLQ